MSLAFEQFMKAKGVHPRLELDPTKPIELVFGSAELITRKDFAGKNDVPAMKLIVRDRRDGEIKQWVTESIVVADRLRKIDEGTVFTVQPKQKGATKSYDIVVKGKAEGE